jgi:RimJ/RimL family protein N-acetyltransferase
LRVLARGDMVVGDPRSEGPDAISFRPLRYFDLLLLHRWLNTPHVARWWYGDDTSWHGVQKEYTLYIEGQEPVEPYLILHHDRPIGYIQTYLISHDEEYARLVGVEHSAGVDMFIGEEEYLYMGLGREILRRFLNEVVFRDEGVRVCVIGPEPKNVAAIRAYEKAGFHYFKTIQVPREPEPEHLMRIGREEVPGA